MASNDKTKKRVAVTSPIGTFRFPKLNEPDYGSVKFKKPDGEYSLGLVFKHDSPEFKQFMTTLTPYYEEALSEAAAAFKELPIGTRKKLGKVQQNDLFTVIYDKETEEPTGEVFFKASMKASGEYKSGPKAGKRWARKPAIYDAKGNYLSKAPEIWGGSTGRINVELTSYFIPGSGAAGLKLNLVGVQIISLAVGGMKKAKSLGFGAIEDGYEYTEQPSEDASDTSTDDNNNIADGADF